MLYLSRKIGESIVVNNAIELTVIEIRGKTVKLGFVFPPDATVLRKEIYDKILAENMAAAGSGDGDVDFGEVDLDFPSLDPLPLPEKK
jgi:carbon storage regulator